MKKTLMKLGAILCAAFDFSRLALANSAGLVKENVTLNREAEEAFATRHLLCKTGTAAATQVLICTASSMPLGVVPDEPAEGDQTTVEPLGIGDRTKRMVAGGAVTAGALVYTAAGGKVTELSASAGTYYKVGRALSEGSGDGSVIEVLPCFPLATVVS